jgi:hypothetical protein
MKRHRIRELNLPRPLNREESALLDFLLTDDSPRVECLSKQKPQVRVSAECRDCRTIELTVAAADVPERHVTTGVVSEALGRDEDGEPIQVLLHVRDGFLAEIEVFRYDDRDVTAFPATSSLRLSDAPLVGKDDDPSANEVGKVS